MVSESQEKGESPMSAEFYQGWWKEGVEEWYETQARRAQNVGESLRNRGWWLTTIGIAMLVVGLLVVWGAVSEFGPTRRTDLRFLEVMAFPLVYLLTVWFAPALIAVLSGFNALGAGKLFLRMSKHLGLMAVYVPCSMESSLGLANLLVTKNVLGREETDAALLQSLPRKLIERLAALELTGGEVISQKWSEFVHKKSAQSSHKSKSAAQ